MYCCVWDNKNMLTFMKTRGFAQQLHFACILIRVGDVFVHFYTKSYPVWTENKTQFVAKQN